MRFTFVIIAAGKIGLIIAEHFPSKHSSIRKNACDLHAFSFAIDVKHGNLHAIL
jgi:hypothetical protein